MLANRKSVLSRSLCLGSGDIRAKETCLGRERALVELGIASARAVFYRDAKPIFEFSGT